MPQICHEFGSFFSSQNSAMISSLFDRDLSLAMLIAFCVYLLAVQELFTHCGADKAEDALWPKLGEVHLPHNGLTELDASLVKY